MSDRWWLRIAHAVLALAIVITVVLLIAPDAFGSTAAPVGQQLNLCSPEAPQPQPPDSDLPGVFVEQPQQIAAPADANRADTSRLFETSGVSGMRPIVYDMGCGFDPRNTDERIGAWTNSSIAGWFITWGQTFTTATSAVEQYAWDPAWIGGLLGDLAENTVGQVQAKVILPFLVIGLLACSVLLVVKARRGDVSGVMQAAAWVLLVLVIAAVVIARPTTTATTTQAAAGSVVSALHGTQGSPTLGATNTIMDGVHYQGWLRRTFGTDSSETARRYGPVLLAATRTTWAEQQATDPGRARSDAEREQILDRREAMIKAKADLFNQTAEKIKKEDPEAYTWLTGRQASFGVAVYEWLFAGFASAFRFLAGIIILLGLLTLAVLGLVWLIALPFLVTPWGESLGRGLLDAAARAVGFIVVAGVGTWLYLVYAGIVMKPGTPDGLALFLVGVGSFGFWGALRPDRKILSLLTLGKVRGRGKWSRSFIKHVGMAAVASRLVAQDAAERVAKEVRDGQHVTAATPTTSAQAQQQAKGQPRKRPPRPSARPPKPPASIVNPPPGSTSQVYTPPPKKRPPRSTTGAATPAPPPPGATGYVNQAAGSVYTPPKKAKKP